MSASGRREQKNRRLMWKRGDCGLTGSLELAPSSIPVTWDRPLEEMNIYYCLTKPETRAELVWILQVWSSAEDSLEKMEKVAEELGAQICILAPSWAPLSVVHEFKPTLHKFQSSHPFHLVARGASRLLTAEQMILFTRAAAWCGFLKVSCKSL